jgi:hypothetical protein
MFPNVRLQIVALFVSVVALSFGFGVFAAFRVNHEPLAQIRASATPLQLGAEDVAPSSPATSWGAPFGSRFWLSETQIHGAADLPALTPVVRHDITERTMTWVVVTGSVAGSPPPSLQPPPAAPDVQSVAAPLPPKRGDAPEETAAPQVAPTAVVGAAEPAVQVEPETTSAVPEHAAQEPKLNEVPVNGPREAAPGAAEPAAQVELETTSVVPEHAAQEPKLHEVPVNAPRKAARAVTYRRHVATKAPIRPQTGVQSAGQREEPVVFQTAPPPYRPQKGTPVAARSGSQNSTTDAPVFQTAPPSQR